MNKKNIMYVLLVLGLSGGALPSASAADKVKPSAEVEAKLAKVIKDAYPEVVIKEMARGTEDGLSLVVIQFTSKGNKMDADVTEDGIIVGTEEAAEITMFPKPAAKALKKLTKGMKIIDTEIARTYAEADKNDKSGTKAIKLAVPKIAYEMDVEKGGKKGEFAVSADGTVLESPEWAKSAGKKEKD